MAADPEAEARRVRTRALVRHARAVNAIFEAQEIGGKASPEQVKELHEARRELGIAFKSGRRLGLVSTGQAGMNQTSTAGLQIQWDGVRNASSMRSGEVGGCTISSRGSSMPPQPNPKRFHCAYSAL